MVKGNTRAASQTLVLCALVLATSQAKDLKEFTVTCTDSERCILPCQFRSDGKGARIMWYRKGAIVSCTRYGDTSFVIGSNAQVESYKGRTGLYADQVLEGNAALTLQNVTAHDQDKYFCVTMTVEQTGQSGVVSLLIKAPVRRVDMGFTDGAVTCSSSGIYPRPSLVWSTVPPDGIRSLRDRTTINETQKGFYDIQSSLQLKGNERSNTVFICRVASDTNHRTAFLRQQAPIVACPGSTVTLPCSVPHNSSSFSVSWTFGGSDHILTLTVARKKPLVKVYDRWKSRVSVKPHSPAHLTLDQLQGELEGVFTCEVTTAEETHITLTEVVVQQDEMNTRAYITVGCSLVLFAIVLMLTFKRDFFKKFVGKFLSHGRGQKVEVDNQKPDELQELN